MPKSLWIIRILLLIAAVGAATSTRADITYTVNETVGAGSVTGFITTDGTIGTLAQANILDWNLTLNDPTIPTAPTFDLLGPLSGQFPFISNVTLQGSDLTSTSTQLLFNFSGTDFPGFLIFQFPESQGGPFVCFVNSSLPCGLQSPASSVSLSTLPNAPITFLFPDVQISSLTGNQVIAAGGVATPEPSTITLMLAGIGLGLVVMRKR